MLAILAVPASLASAVYLCKGTNLTDPQESEKLTKLGVLFYLASNTLLVLGQWITIAFFPLAELALEAMLHTLVASVMTCYLWGAAKRFSGNRWTTAYAFKPPMDAFPTVSEIYEKGQEKPSDVAEKESDNTE